MSRTNTEYCKTTEVTTNSDNVRECYRSNTYSREVVRLLMYDYWK